MMTEYLAKMGFWLRAYDSVTIEAANDSEAIEKAKQAARTRMESRSQPEAIDTDKRREGVIAYIDRLAPDHREAVVEAVAFEDDHIHAPLRDLVRRIAAQVPIGPMQMADCTDATCRCRAFIDEARRLLDAGA